MFLPNLIMEVLFLCLLALKLANPAAITADDLVISLPNGQVKGASYVTTNNVTYYGFRGIPYAVPPIADLRFEVAQPAEDWQGILDATNDKKSCISINHFATAEFESEDCLYINVYVPVLEPEEKLPVLLWIHGGSFTGGSSLKTLYGPDYLIERDVIFVSFNYRLIAFGFISTQDDVLPGNLGLKDQNLAMQWVRQNIEYFGGDPEKITIFGESAGGAATGLHLVSKLSAGLFRAAIVESGSALTNWSIDATEARTTSFLLADGIPGGDYGNSSTELKEFLKNSSVDEIVTASVNLYLSSKRQFWPVIEVENVDAFLTDSPYVLLENGDFNQVPIVIGICAEESLLFFANLDSVKSQALAADELGFDVIPGDLRPNDTDLNTVIKEINSIYLTDGETYSDNLAAFADHLTDVSFANGVLKHAELASKYVPVYLYQFAYYGRPITEPFIPGAEKASHGAEIPFLFDTSFVPTTTVPEDLQIQAIMTTLWTNFAKILNPTPEISELFENYLWPVLDFTESPQYFNINNTLDVKADLKGEAYSKWNEIYSSYGQKPFITF